MGSGYFGEPNMGNHHHHHGSGGGSSRKGKKNSSSDQKPKQPQRGLGVAQLEKIRLTGQLASGCSSTNNSNNSYHHHHPSFHTPYPSNLNHQEDIRGGQTGYTSIPSSSFSYSSSSSLPSYGYNPNIMMGGGDYERTNNIRYGDSQPSTVPSWNLGSGTYDYEPHHHHHSLQPGATQHLFNLHETTSRSKKHRSDSNGSSSQNSESSDSQEVDLELRLSL